MNKDIRDQYARTYGIHLYNTFKLITCYRLTIIDPLFCNELKTSCKSCLSLGYNKLRNMPLNSNVAIALI